MCCANETITNMTVYFVTSIIVIEQTMMIIYKTIEEKELAIPVVWMNSNARQIEQKGLFNISNV
jgi:hypothetical protein